MANPYDGVKKGDIYEWDLAFKCSEEELLPYFNICIKSMELGTHIPFGPHQLKIIGVKKICEDTEGYKGKWYVRLKGNVL